MARPKGAVSYPQRAAKITEVLWKVLRADSFEDLERGCTVLRKRAGEGDLVALGFIFDRIVGRPMPALPDVDSDRAFSITWQFGPSAIEHDAHSVHSPASPAPRQGELDPPAD